MPSDQEKILEKLEKSNSCLWVSFGCLHCMYYYVKKTGSLPSRCQTCWKVLLFLIDAISLQRFKEQLKEERIIDSQGRTLSVFGKRYAFKVIQIERGGRLMVIYTHREEDRDAVRQKLYEICRKVGG